jgi:hypothetical protein
VTKFITIVAVDWVTLLSCLSPTVVLNTPVSEPFNGLYYKPAMIIKVYCKLKCALPSYPMIIKYASG